MGDHSAVHRETKAAREPGLDLLRTIAILLVVLYHMYLQPAPRFLRVIDQTGWMGVDLFFVLSGFLIGSQLLRPYLRNETPSLRVFYLRRAFRVLPAFWAVLLVYLLVPGFREQPNLPDAWRFVTFTQNFGLHAPAAFSHAWSLLFGLSSFGSLADAEAKSLESEYRCRDDIYRWAHRPIHDLATVSGADCERPQSGKSVRGSLLGNDLFSYLHAFGRLISWCPFGWHPVVPSRLVALRHGLAGHRSDSCPDRAESVGLALLGSVLVLRSGFWVSADWARIRLSGGRGRWAASANSRGHDGSDARL